MEANQTPIRLPTLSPVRCEGCGKLIVEALTGVLQFTCPRCGKRFEVDSQSGTTKPLKTAA